MYLPFSPASSVLLYQQSPSPPNNTHQFLHRCMHSEPQRCFRLQPLRTYRRRFVHYYSASYLTLLKIRISLFEYHPNTGIILTFVPYDTHFLHYRQIFSPFLMSPTFFSDIYIGITATLPSKQHLHRQNSSNLQHSQTNCKLITFPKLSQKKEEEGDHRKKRFTPYYIKMAPRPY